MTMPYLSSTGIFIYTVNIPELDSFDDVIIILNKDILKRAGVFALCLHFFR